MRSYDLDFGQFDASSGEEVFNSEKYLFDVPAIDPASRALLCG